MRFKHQIYALHPGNKPRRTVAPDIDDPNWYCRSCKKKYQGLGYYRAHLRRAHGIELEPVRTVRTTYLDPETAIIDINDPANTSCIYCMRKYINKCVYNRHMKTVHKDGRIEPAIVQ